MAVVRRERRLQPRPGRDRLQRGARHRLRLAQAHQGPGWRATSSRTAPTRSTSGARRAGSGCKDAEQKAIERLVELGVTDKDLKRRSRRAHPLGPIAKKDRKAFLASLTDDELKTFERAEAWYKQRFLEGPAQYHRLGRALRHRHGHAVRRIDQSSRCGPWPRAPGTIWPMSFSADQRHVVVPPAFVRLKRTATRGLFAPRSTFLIG
jgi:hypothetical protein